jgi:hypothetical protein
MHDGAAAAVAEYFPTGEATQFFHDPAWCHQKLKN